MSALFKRGPLDASRVMFLPVDAIAPNPYQPRQTFAREELDELAQSIRALGVLQPLTVRKGEGGWELVAGERRLRAARLAGLDRVPCLSVRVDGQTTSLLALVENVQRTDLDFWEEALALRRLLDTFHLSQEEAARRVGKSQSAVANKLRLLRLPPEVLARLRAGGFTERHARALLKLEGSPLLEQAVDLLEAEQLTVVQTEALVESLLSPAPDAPRRKAVFARAEKTRFICLPPVTPQQGKGALRQGGCTRGPLQGPDPRPGCAAQRSIFPGPAAVPYSKLFSYRSSIFVSSWPCLWTRGSASPSCQA